MEGSFYRSIPKNFLYEYKINTPFRQFLLKKI